MCLIVLFSLAPEGTFMLLSGRISLVLFSGGAVERGSSTQYFALASTAPTTTASSGASVFSYTQLHETKKEDLQL